jgi:hypothetical protein
MKTTNDNSQFSYNLKPASRASKLSRIGLTLSLTAVLLWNLAASATTCTQVPGPKLAYIYVGSSQVWGRDDTGNVYQYVKATNSFNQILGAVLSQIAVGQGETVWGINSWTGGQIYQYDFTTKSFVQEDPSLSLAQISAGAYGIWGVGLTGGLHYWNSAANTFDKYTHTGFPAVASVSVGTDEPWVIDTSDNPWLYNTNTGFFDKITSAALAQISVGSALYAWAVDNSDNIYTYNVQTEVMDHVTPGNLAQISVLNSDVPWGVYEGKVYDYVGSAFKQQCTAVDSFVQVAAGKSATGTWALTSDGVIYHF